MISNSKNNSVFEKGTPRLKILKGRIFSLLTGGGGNSNYFHWLLDVLPRLVILEKKLIYKKLIIFYFQIENLTFKEKV